MPEQWEHKDLYREIVTNLLEGVMVIGMNGKITMLNPAAEQILGLSQEDIGNSFINVFLTREGTDDFSEAILDTIYEKGKVSNLPVDYVLEGETRNLSLTTSYIRNAGEKSVVVVMEDVTELNELRDAQTALDKIRKLNQEYEKAKDEAVRANEAKSLFLSNMSHEIRTPINAVLGMNEMILRECADKQILSYAANIRSSGKTLLFLINDILDMSKIESGKMEIVRVEYEPENMMMDLWNVIFLRAQEKGLSIRFSLDETLPRVLYGDDVRIKQIVTNLLTNAVKYTPQGGIEMTAAYERAEDGMIRLIISVKDTGMGIRKEDMGKLFESFQRLDEEKNRNIEGTGLGMNITMSLLKLMDGDMKVESEYGKGSVFTVTIPQRIVCDEPTGDFESIRKRREETLSKKQQSFEAPEARVLVVDDNSMNLTVFQSLLKRTKMQITTADSGKRCLELVKQEPYHIIFMDHMMPELDGVETTHIIRRFHSEYNDVPIIALTANAVEGTKEMFCREGMNDFVAKPIEIRIMVDKVRQWLPVEKIQKTKLVYDMADREEKSSEPIVVGDLDTKLAMGFFGSEKLFWKTLKVYYNSIEKKANTIKAMVENKDWTGYTIEVHALKSASKQIGAVSLSRKAAAMEKAGNARDSKAIHSHTDEMLKQYLGYLSVLEPFCAEEEEDEAQKKQVSKEILEQHFERISAAIEDLDMDQVEEVIAEMNQYRYDTRQMELFHQLKEAVEEFDVDRCEEILGTWRRMGF